MLKIVLAGVLAVPVAVAATGVVVVDVQEPRGGRHLVIPVPLALAQAAAAFVPPQKTRVHLGSRAARYLPVAQEALDALAEAADAEFLWGTLMERGALPCGLGARDVLRLEAGLPLHGHEIDPDTTPIQAGLERFVRQEGEFVGAPVLRQQQRDGVARKLVGMKLPGRSAPRAGYPILADGQTVGQVTSGSYSPTLDTSIAMGYVLVRCAAPGQALEVDIRGRTAPAQVAPLPFYTRPRRRPEPAEGRSQAS